MDYKKKTLENGLRIIAIPMPESYTTTVWILTETGSMSETKRLSGASHFLEHLCFKGTKNRPDPLAISAELDGLGAQSNAFTSHEYTGYFAKAENRHFKQLLDIVADIFQNPIFPNAEVEKEKGVIVGEIDMYEDHPKQHIDDVLTNLLYGDQPAGWNVAGTKESVRAMTRADIISYRKKNYVPEATTVVVAGGVSHKAVFSSVAKLFGGLLRGRKPRAANTKESQRAPRAAIERRKTRQTHCALGFRSWDIYDARNPALIVLAGILGKGMSSRLFKRLRDDMGVGYYAFAANDFYTDHGCFAIFAGVENARLVESVEAVSEELRRIKDEHISEEELTKAKNLLVGTMLSSLETSDALASYYGEMEILHRDIQMPEDRAAAIRAVTAQDVRAVAREIFCPEKANIAVIGPASNKKQLEKILGAI